MTIRSINRPTILAALLLAAVIGATSLVAPGSAADEQSGHVPGYPYATLSSVSR